jgi:hypothetical protein
MVNSMGAYVFIFYAALDLIMSVLAFIFVKETKGRSIEEMETIFNSRAAFDVLKARERGAEESDAQIIEHVIADDPLKGKRSDSDA